MSQIKYLLHPGYVRSKHDGDRHFISAPKLRKLYRVPEHESRTYGEQHQHMPAATCIHLYPDVSGDYELPIYGEAAMQGEVNRLSQELDEAQTLAYNQRKEINELKAEVARCKAEATGPSRLETAVQELALYLPQGCGVSLRVEDRTTAIAAEYHVPGTQISENLNILPAVDTTLAEQLIAALSWANNREWHHRGTAL